MKRAYVDITGEYYDRTEYIREMADAFGIVESDLYKIFYSKQPRRKQKLKDE